MAVSGGGEEDMDELKRVHGMIEEIYFIAPSLLLNVIPQLEEEMTLDELGIRQLAIETLGNMFAHKASTLYKQYPNIWKGWLGREVDKSAVIRTRWLELCGTIYLNHAENVANDINGNNLVYIHVYEHVCICLYIYMTGNMYLFLFFFLHFIYFLQHA